MNRLITILTKPAPGAASPLANAATMALAAALVHFIIIAGMVL